VKLVFDGRALADLEAVYDWIAKDNPSTAKAVVDRMFASIEHLAAHPRMGHAGRDLGTLEWVVPRLPYIVIYEVHDASDEVVIVAVVHGAQDRERGS
jgi:addiction module RelE/StbE family toxin